MYDSLDDFRMHTVIAVCTIHVLSVPSHLLVVMGWAGNFGGPVDHPGHMEVDPLLAPTPSPVDCN